MPTISMFYGIIILIYYFHNQQHNTPHITKSIVQLLKYQAVKPLEGYLPKVKQKLVDAWVELRQEDLLADWQLAINGDLNL